MLIQIVLWTLGSLAGLIVLAALVHRPLRRWAYRREERQAREQFKLQRETLEAKFFEQGGGDYRAPAQRASDFLAGRESASLGATSYKFGVVSGRIDAMLPEGVRDALRRSLVAFDRQIPGFAGEEGTLVGVETRCSAPLRMPRHGDTFRARGFQNLYPVGEGAGYAGGILSAAIDGARAAQALLRTPA